MKKLAIDGLRSHMFLKCGIAVHIQQSSLFDSIGIPSDETSDEAGKGVDGNSE